MKIAILIGAAMALALPPTISRAELKDENVLLPVPAAFKVGINGTQGSLKVVELIPQTESLDRWTIMVTEQIRYGLVLTDPDKLPALMLQGWSNGCPGGEGARVETMTENGYPATVWKFTCSNNPTTRLPENMFLKVIAGADALYSVQYAFRRSLTNDDVSTATNYLRKVSLCDTRTSPAHPCPNP